MPPQLHSRAQDTRGSSRRGGGTIEPMMRALLLALTLTTAAFVTQAIEEPAYELARQIGDVELRTYAPYVVAEVLVTGSAGEAGGQAFPLLAGYIFGKNKGEKKFAMTAPVTQTAVPEKPVPAKLAMTAPVMQAAAPGGYRVQFVLPRGVSLATAPEPIDPRVTLREVAASQVAVIRYSGFWSQSNYDDHLARLQTALTTAGLRWAGEPVLSRYDPPWTPWFLRRNEIWLTLP